MPSAPSRILAAAPLALLAACASTASTPAAAPAPAAPVPFSQAPAPAAPAPAARPAVPARPEDVATPEATVRALYQVISGPAGPRDWNRLRSLFTPGARLVFSVTQRDGRVVYREGTVEQYIAANTPYLMEHGWQEHEVASKVERYGSIVHIFSTYEGDEGPGTERERGINSIQLSNHDGRWWVVSLLVEKEAEWNPIPRQYLP